MTLIVKISLSNKEVINFDVADSKDANAFAQELRNAFDSNKFVTVSNIVINTSEIVFVEVLYAGTLPTELTELNKEEE